MTRILVIYGTTDGQTERVAQEIGRALRLTGVDASVFQASSAAPGPEDYAGVIVAASLRAGRYQRTVRRWIRQHGEGLRDKPGAFVSVCMMARDRREATQQRLMAIMRAFVESCGWMPVIFKPVAGTLAYTRYDWLTRWMIKRMAAKMGDDTDTSRDHEYTDWADVRAFAREFLTSVWPALRQPATSRVPVAV
jgi:menaquinone-dependent protoporphyrinogen oxidase